MADDGVADGSARPASLLVGTRAIGDGAAGPLFHWAAAGADAAHRAQRQRQVDTVAAAAAQHAADTPVTVASAAKPKSRTADLLREATARMGQSATASASRTVPGAAERPSLQVALQRGDVGVRQRGVASWYSNALHGELTANGERYDRNELTAAHPTLPLGSWVKVSRAGSTRSVLVRINDRGPFAKSRIIDLSYRAASQLGIIGAGTARVVMEVVAPPDESAGTRVATAS